MTQPSAPNWQGGGTSQEGASADETSGGGLKAMSILFTILSLSLMAFGWWRMYSYDDEVDKLVGGDAYNLGILASRGTGLITAGVGLGVIAVVFALLAIAAKLDAVSKADAK